MTTTQFAAHQAADPHCSCNDCLADSEIRREESYATTFDQQLAAGVIDQAGFAIEDAPPTHLNLNDITLWTDPAGVTHKATVVDIAPGRFPRATIEYWDNSRRGTVSHAGRTWNHGTRARVVVYQRELRPVSA